MDENSTSPDKRETPKKQMFRSMLGFVAVFAVFAGMSYGVFKITRFGDRVREEGYEGVGKAMPVEIAPAETAFISTFLHLSSEQSRGFWPVYMQYRQQWSQVAADRTALCDSVAARPANNATYTALTEDLADTFSRQAAIVTDFARKFARMLPPDVAAKAFVVQYEYAESPADSTVLPESVPDPDAMDPEQVALYALYRAELNASLETLSGIRVLMVSDGVSRGSGPDAAKKYAAAWSARASIVREYAISFRKAFPPAEASRLLVRGLE